MTLEDVLKVIAALAGLGTAISTASYAMARYVRDLNKQIVDTVTKAYELRLSERDATIAKQDLQIADLRSTVDRQTEASLKQTESQVSLIAQQQQLIAALQAKGSS